METEFRLLYKFPDSKIFQIQKMEWNVVVSDDTVCRRNYKILYNSLQIIFN